MATANANNPNFKLAILQNTNNLLKNLKGVDDDAEIAKVIHKLHDELNGRLENSLYEIQSYRLYVEVHAMQATVERVEDIPYSQLENLKTETEMTVKYFNRHKGAILDEFGREVPDVSSKINVKTTIAAIDLETQNTIKKIKEISTLSIAFQKEYNAFEDSFLAVIKLKAEESKAIDLKIYHNQKRVQMATVAEAEAQASETLFDNDTEKIAERKAATDVSKGLRVKLSELTTLEQLQKAREIAIAAMKTSLSEAQSKEEKLKFKSRPPLKSKLPKEQEEFAVSIYTSVSRLKTFLITGMENYKDRVRKMVQSMHSDLQTYIKASVVSIREKLYLIKRKHTVKRKPKHVECYPSDFETENPVCCWKGGDIYSKIMNAMEQRVPMIADTCEFHKREIEKRFDGDIRSTLFKTVKTRDVWTFNFITNRPRLKNGIFVNGGCNT